MSGDIWEGWSGVILAAGAQAVDEGANTVWEGWGSVILVVGIVALVAGLLAVLIWQVFKTAQSRIAHDAISANEHAYRTLAEQATEAQQQTAAQLEELREGISELRGRVAAIERLLSEVG